jgi:hypothetical protein
MRNPPTGRRCTGDNPKRNHEKNYYVTGFLLKLTGFLLNSIKMNDVQGGMLR